jgi:hypothetical protein
MNLEEVKQFLQEQKDNEEVKSYLQELSKVTVNGVSAFLDTEDGKKLLQPKLDSFFTKGLETWKGNNPKKLVDEEVSKRNPSETPEQKRIRELEEKIEKAEKERTREILKNKALSSFAEKKLPTFFIDHLIGNDEDSTNANLTKFEEVWNNQKVEFLKNNAQSFGNQGNNPPNNQNTVTKEEFAKMTYSDRVKLANENPELYKALNK